MSTPEAHAAVFEFQGGEVQFRRAGKGARATLVVDGASVGAVDVPFAMFMMSSIGPSVGFDHGSQVSQAYDHPFPFEGDLHRIDIQLVSARDADAQAAETDARSSMARQ